MPHGFDPAPVGSADQEQNQGHATEEAEEQSRGSLFHPKALGSSRNGAFPTVGSTSHSMRSIDSGHSMTSESTTKLRSKSGTLSGHELEEFANANGLCPLCAQTRTRKRVFKMFRLKSRRKKVNDGDGAASGNGKWEPLTVQDKQTAEYIVYKGYCVKPTCFSLDQAKRLAGEISDSQPSSWSSSPPHASAGKTGASNPSYMSRLRGETRKSPESSRELSRSRSDSYDHGGMEEMSDRMDLDHSELMSSSKRNIVGAFPPPELKQSTGSRVTDGSENEQENEMQQEQNTANLPLILVHKCALVLRHDTSITTLDLSSVALRHIDVSLLSSALPGNDRLNNLIMEGCKMDDEAMVKLASGLAEAVNLPLAKLYLRSNLFGDEGIEALANKFLTTNETVEKLDLSRNRITSPGGVVLFHALSRNRRTQIRCINLSHNELCEVDSILENGLSVGLCSLLAKNETLRVLNLEGNVIHDVSCESISKGIRRCGDQSTLERLYLGWNGIGDDGTIALAKMLETNRSLRILGLGENEIRNTGARALLSAMDLNTTVREISGLWRNQIDRRFIIVAIRRLLLSHNDESMRQLDDDESTIHDSDSAIRRSETADYQSSINQDPDLKKPVPAVSVPRLETMKEEEPKRRQSDSVMPSISKIPKPAPATRNVTVPAVSTESTEPVGFDRMTVFQSVPLINFDRETQTRRPIPVIDFDYETDILRRSLLSATKAKIEVGFEAPTLDNLKTYLQSAKDRILYLSCHGNEKNLMLENGFGSSRMLPLDGLPKLVESISDQLQIVFVSSPHARAIGDAFIEAGIKHVVCCQRDSQFRDYIATKFTVVFFQALSIDKTLWEAFDAARNAVIESAHTKNTRVITERFRLLPEKQDNNGYHAIPVFSAGSTTETSRVLLNNHKPLALPRMPPHFVGREVDMYEIMEALRVEDIVRVTGVPGIGKSATVTSACRYVMRRQETFKIDDILWFPSGENATVDEHVAYRNLCCLYDLMVDNQRDVIDDDLKIEYWGRIGKELLGKRIIVVIDDRQSSRKRATQEGLENFMACLLELANIKIILMASSPSSSDEHSVMSMSTPGSSISESLTSIDIAPLDFRSTTLLFAGVSKFITSGGCPAAHTPKEFLELLQPPHVAAIQGSVSMSKRLTALFERLGKGVPLDVTNTAKRMTKTSFIELIQIASAPEVLANSLSTLENSISRLNDQKERSIVEKNFLRASDLDQVLTELNGMRSSFSSIDDLRKQETELKKQLAAVVASRQYDVANSLKKQMLDLKRRIMKEQRGDVDGTTTANMRINDLQSRVQKMMDSTSAHSDRCRSATFVVNCRNRDCSFVISCGSMLDFQHPSVEAGMICWTNENCDIKTHEIGQSVIDCGGEELEKDVSCLPVIKRTEWGVVRCETGNAVMIGPEKYGKLGVSFVIFSVGPVSPSNQDEIDIDDKDGLHYTNIMLRSSYRSSLVLIKHAQLQAIALNMLTTKEGGFGWEKNLQVGLETLIEGVHQSHLRDVHIYASSPRESAKLIEIATQIGLRRI